MAVFDLKTYLALTGRGNNGILALGSAFGMPQCMLNLGSDLLSLLPSPILSELEDSAMDGRDAADEVIKKIVKYTLGLTGIIEYDTEQGVFRFVSDSSKYGNDRDEGSFLGKSLAFLNAAAQFGGRLYENYQSTQAQINSISECFGTYKTYLDYTGGNSGTRKDELARTNPDAFTKLFEAEFETNKRRITEAANFINQADDLIDNIREIIRQRQEDPELEPIFNRDAKDLLDGTGFRIGNTKDEEPEEIIRLVYGPPRSKSGQFLLSTDGLYYDSQTSGLTKVLSYIQNQTSSVATEYKWKFNFDPNLGGRGTAISDSTFKEYTNTVFDPTIIDNSNFLVEFYKADHLLQQLEGQKNKRLADINRQIKELESDSTAPQAILLNLRQTLFSETAYHDDKVRRRKKQIEVAVKAPALYGNTVYFTPGNIPINDFSYLRNFNYNVELTKQKKLILDQDEVSGVVAPIIPKFVVAVPNETAQNITHLMVPPVGAGGIIYDGVSVSSDDGLVLDLSDRITTDGLIAVYNYLETHISQASSNEFLLTNCAVTGNIDYAQLVSYDSDELFDKGVGIVHLEGVTKHSTDTVTSPSSVGSYIRLPDSTKFNDWLYSRDGATFETWIHMPGLNSWEKWGSNDASALFRLVLASENVGISPGATNLTYSNDIQPSFGSQNTRGVIMGFTRDARFTQNSSPTNDHYAQDPMNGVKFVIAPTQSISVSEAVFTRRIGDDGICYSDSFDFHSMTIWTSAANAAGDTLDFISNEFGLLDVVFDVATDQILVYLNASLLATSSLSRTFGITPGFPPQLPNFRKSNSHDYKKTNLGPPLNKYFTPWILGGGYTDGYVSGNFMGGSYGGIRSSLNGYLGSTKFYDKALTQAQIVNNYNTQGGFFSNIQTYINTWDPIEMGSWGP